VLKAELDQCDGGTGMWAKAKESNGGKDPVVQKGTSVIDTGGSTDLKTGTITLDPTQTQCSATQTELFELTNLWHKPTFEQVAATAAAGNLSREDFIKANERIEYDAVQKSLTACDACKAVWGCDTCVMEWARPYKTFDDYYAKGASSYHKEYYGKAWDQRYKAAYQAKHH
jgi:hypothetical protein